MKALGKDINEFYNNHFPENSVIDDDADWIENFINDAEGLNLIPTEKYELDDFGWVVNDVSGRETRFTTLFKKWLKKQNTVTLAIQVSRDKEEEVRQKLKEWGLKVL